MVIVFLTLDSIIQPALIFKAMTFWFSKNFQVNVFIQFRASFRGIVFGNFHRKFSVTETRCVCSFFSKSFSVSFSQSRWQSKADLWMSQSTKPGAVWRNQSEISWHNLSKYALMLILVPIPLRNSIEATSLTPWRIIFTYRIDWRILVFSAFPLHLDPH